MRKSFLLLVSFISMLAGFGQNRKEFSPSLPKFPSEAIEFMTYSESLLDDEKKIVEKFKILWDSSVINIDEKDKILSIANLMITKKIRPKPQFYNYIHLLVQFNESKSDVESFANWLQNFEAFVSNKKTTTAGIDKILLITRNIVEFNSLNVYSSGRWSPRTMKYKFENINNRFMAVFGKTDIVGYSNKNDSIEILGTKGAIDLIDLKWYGEGGTVTWQRAGIPVNEINIKLKKYNIDLTRNYYKADSVEYYNTKYFKEPVMGTMEDRIAYIPTPEKANYPQFETYAKSFFIKNLYEGINYKGGYSMQGQKFIGKATRENPATLYFYYKDTLRILARSNYFVFSPEKINGLNTKISIYLASDSIYHGNVGFNFAIKNKELTVTQTEEYSAKGPFQDSYHKLDISFEQLRWKMDDPIIYFTMHRGGSIGKAYFESYNFFDPAFFEAMMGMDEAHPLYALKKFSDKNQYHEFPVNDYAQYIRHSPDQVRTQVTQLMILGYLVYDGENDYIRLQPKLFETVKASLGRIDYDVIKFQSVTRAPQENARLNIRNLDLVINGIPDIRISSVQNVVIYPDSSRITMKSNRSFGFGGRVDAGLLTFFGKNFYFNYDSFKINLLNMDSIRIRILLDSVDQYGHQIQQTLTSVIVFTSGFLYVDKPHNKSGLKKYPEFPIFHSVKTSNVYYTKADKAYTNDFYFEIHPFVFDSLNTFNARDLKLKGRFVSGGIFPDLNQELVVQKDYSLGFSLDSTLKDMPAYGGKGKFDIKLSLSNKGLRGSGKLDYLASTTVSDDFKLYPDSMNTDARTFDIKRTPPLYPYVNVDVARVRWKPKADHLYVRNLKDPFIVINDQTKLAGQLDLRPKGLVGSGVMDLTTASLKSNQFSYGPDQINSDTTDFNLLSLKNSGMTMKTTNVQAHVDYSQRKGEFKSNSGASYTEFPENQYASYLDEFIWNMDKKEVSMTSQKKHAQPYTAPDSLYHLPTELQGAKFVSMKKNQDSLNFIVPVAVYNYQDNVIQAKKVTYIRVADALVFPDKGEVEIKENAAMRSLSNSRVLANVNTRYHNFHTAEIAIQSKKSYVGSGSYDYIDQDKKIQTLKVGEMKVDTSEHTIGFISVSEPDSFLLNPMFHYIGKVTIKSKEKFFYYDGAARIRVSCDTVPRSWVYFKSQLDPDTIIIPIGDQLKDINRKPLYVGTMLSSEPRIHMYSTFLGQRDDYSDKAVVTASQYLTYDKNSREYRIAELNKLKNIFSPGNMVSLSRDSCVQSGEGKLNMGVDLGQLKLTAYGTTKHKLPQDEMTMNISLGLKFLMLPASMDQMAADIDTFAKNIPVDVSNMRQVMKMRHTLGRQRTDNMMNEIQLYGKLNTIPEELQFTIYLSDVNLYWNKKSRSYCSKGKIGIGHIMSHQLNRYVDGYLEITRKKSGDFLDLYLKVNDHLWYYFGYTRGVMQVLSPEKKFTTPIQMMKPEMRTMKTKRSETPYSYLVSTDMKFGDFISRFESYSKAQLEEEETPEPKAAQPGQQPADTNQIQQPMQNNPGEIKAPWE